MVALRDDTIALPLGIGIGVLFERWVGSPLTEAIRERRKTGGELGPSAELIRHVSLNWTSTKPMTRPRSRANTPGTALECASARALLSPPPGLPLHPIAADVGQTIVGMACRVPDPTAIEIILGGVSRTATVEEAEIRSSMRHLFAGRTAAVQFKDELE